MKKYSKEQQKMFMDWAIKCAKHTLKFFEKVYPKDKRPRVALDVAKKYLKTGIFKMKIIRKAALDAHKAARKAEKEENLVACYAARSCGHAVATAHIAQHAYGSCLYSLKAVINHCLENIEKNILKELNWQKKNLHPSLRNEVFKRIVIEKKKDKIIVKLKKDKNF